jgi:fructose-1,6-bisphosphatase/inositol monophosphatase family enzyme
VDRACETLIRERLLKAFPTDGFLGEETPALAGSGGRRWIVDPLDGTRPYLRGIPTHSVLIALEEEDKPVVGIIHLPAMNITCWATRGNGAYKNGKPIRVSTVSSIAGVTGTALGFREKADSGEGRALLTLMRAWDYAYGFMDAYSYVCIASGNLDLAVNLLDKPWDCASAACIVAEAGGTYSDIAGERSIHNGSIILSNGLVHEEALRFFSPA